MRVILYACSHLVCIPPLSLSLHCCLCRPSFSALSLLFCRPLLILFYLPILDKSKAHIAREQLVSAISNHYCTSQSPSFLQHIFFYSGHSINLHYFGRCPGIPTLKAPQRLFYILSLFCIFLTLYLPFLMSHISFHTVFFHITFI